MQSISSLKSTTSYCHSTPVILNLVVCLSDAKKLIELGKVPGIVKSVAKMIGQDKRLIIKKSTLGTYTLYIDIPFFFNRYKRQHGLSIPLIALLYNKLHLKFFYIFVDINL